MHSINTKLVVTIGPNSESYEKLKALAQAGMGIARMNFSHCTYEEYKLRIANIKRVNDELGINIKIMQDLQGPRIRVGKLPDEGIELKEGEIFSFAYGKKTDAAKKLIEINDPHLAKDVKKGDPFYLINGSIQLDIIEIKNNAIVAKVTKPGTLFTNKAINVPKTKLSNDPITEKDIKDIKFAIKEHCPDYIALSFVQSATELRNLRKIIGKHNVQIIPKIERGIALENIDEIIQESDGLMVARGDLGIELKMEDIPIIQKNLIRHAHWHSKPVIVATQMLTSMIENSKPTRAEVSDIANAIFERADAVMLSDETTVGKHPVEAVKMMKRIVTRIENYLKHENYFDHQSLLNGTKTK